ncbi:MAG: hypothetical protein LBU47_04430 [Christensenellaceae bacterium]|nr:hypothetical protein [Christensenellaceae bacterium]
MFIQQLSVYIENHQGRLADFCALLGGGGIDLSALSIADTSNFGLIRAIVSDNDKALSLLQQNGFAASLTPVLAVSVADAPSGLANVLQILREGGFSIEYLYSFMRRINHEAIILFRIDKPEEAAGLLLKKGIRLLSQEEIAR